MVDLSGQTLHTYLTQLLMDNGAAVTKKSIDELILYIATRDQEIIRQIIRDAEKSLDVLQQQTSEHTTTIS